MSEFIEMGGYAVYVWSSYGLSAAVLTAFWLLIHKRERRMKKDFSGRTHDS